MQRHCSACPADKLRKRSGMDDVVVINAFRATFQTAASAPLRPPRHLRARARGVLKPPPCRECVRCAVRATAAPPARSPAHLHPASLQNHHVTIRATQMPHPNHAQRLRLHCCEKQTTVCVASMTLLAMQGRITTRRTRCRLAQAPRVGLQNLEQRPLVRRDSDVPDLEGAHLCRRPAAARGHKASPRLNSAVPDSALALSGLLWRRWRRDAWQMQGRPLRSGDGGLDGRLWCRSWCLLYVLHRLCVAPGRLELSRQLRSAWRGVPQPLWVACRQGDGSRGLHACWQGVSSAAQDLLSRLLRGRCTVGRRSRG